MLKKQIEYFYEQITKLWKYIKKQQKGIKNDFNKKEKKKDVEE